MQGGNDSETMGVGPRAVDQLFNSLRARFQNQNEAAVNEYDFEGQEEEERKLGTQNIPDDEDDGDDDRILVR